MVPRIIITFSGLFNETDLQSPALEDGLTFGTNRRRCQVLLGGPGTQSISSQHFTIFVDEELHLWLRDDSRYGTAVEVNSEHQEDFRKNHTWILAQAAGSELMFEEVKVHAGRLSVELTFPNHCNSDRVYRSNLQKLVEKCRPAAEQKANGIAGLGRLDLASNVTTAPPSGLATPLSKNTYIDCGIVGEGAFGEVHKVVQSRTGQVFAQKRLHVNLAPQKKKKNKKRVPRSGNKRTIHQVDDNDVEQRAIVEQLRREFRILDENPHVSNRRA